MSEYAKGLIARLNSAHDASDEQLRATVLDLTTCKAVWELVLNEKKMDPDTAFDMIEVIMLLSRIEGMQRRFADFLTMVTTTFFFVPAGPLREL
eukprot:COSAG01_NODE_46765_length_397_cov_0.808725_1_plen_93_part_10